MTAHLIPSPARVGDDRAGGATTPAEAHWLAAADLVTGGRTERQLVMAVAQALADAEQRGRDDVRFGSAYCPDCGIHCDPPHAPTCPLVQIGDTP